MYFSWLYQNLRKGEEYMKKALSILLIIAMILGLTSCSSNTSSTKETNTSPAETKAPNATVTNLNMGTAATTGTYYFVGAAIGNTVSKLSDKLEVLVASTAGGVENVGLVTKGDMDIGMANTDALYDAYNGKGAFEKTGSAPIMGLMALYPSVSHMLVRADSSIESWSDLKGKKVCLGTAGSSHPVASKALLALHGVNWEKDIQPFYLTTGEMMTMLADGDLDAAFLVGGAPVSGITNVSVTTPLRMLDLDESVMDELTNQLPYFTKGKIPAGTYKGIDNDVNAVALTTCFFVNKDMPEDVAYEFVKTTMENLNDFVDSNESCKYITPETVANLPIPIHPGALKYYKEKGWIK